MQSKTQKIKVMFRLRSLEMGGVQKVVLDLLENLPHDKFEFSLLVNLHQGVLRTEIPKHVHYYTIVGGREEMSSFFPIRFVQLVVRNLRLRYYKKYPKKLYKKLGIQHLDIEVASSYSELEDVLKSPLPTKKVGWFHTDIRFLEPSMAKKFIDYMHQYDVMIYGAKQTRDVINEYYQEVFPHAKVIYNVIDKELIDEKAKEFTVEKSDTPVFVSVARLQKRKNFPMLMRAHKRLIDEGLDHKVYIIGDGDQREVLTKLHEELQLDDRLQMLGTLKNPYPYVKSADFFILPSKTESYPLILGETLCLGVPIISTNVGGISEMIDDEVDGVLIQADENEIYQAMRRFLTDHELVNRLKQNAQLAYQKFDKQIIYSQVTETFEKLYLSLIHI